MFVTTTHSIFDTDGEPLLEGDTVILLNAPDELLLGLMAEDQLAIRAQIGKKMPIQGFDEHGNVELEFKSDDENTHFIWVKPINIRKSPPGNRNRGH